MKKYTCVGTAIAVLIWLNWFSADRAEAAGDKGVDGCASKVVLKVDTWGENVGYWGVNIPHPAPDFYVIRLSATTGYWYCPNGRRPNKVKPLWVEYCYSHLNPTHGADNFNGAKFNPYFYDSNESFNPPTFNVGDDGTIQNCRRQVLSGEKWLETRQGARWKITSWVMLQAWPDHEKVFKWKGEEYKPFFPQGDINLGLWHW
jgi:hypothetical protein